jgi:hypothetical protein
VAGTGGNEAQAEFNKQRLADPCVCVTTFNMIAHGGKRSEYGKAVSSGLTMSLRLCTLCVAALHYVLRSVCCCLVYHKDDRWQEVQAL